jgi:hypothetical protein
MTTIDITEKYGIYTTKGVKLKNSDELLKSDEWFWGPITESVLDRTIHDFFGILKHKFYIDGKEHWVVRESAKENFKFAPDWHRKAKPNV